MGRGENVQTTAAPAMRPCSLMTTHWRTLVQSITVNGTKWVWGLLVNEQMVADEARLDKVNTDEARVDGAGKTNATHTAFKLSIIVIKFILQYCSCCTPVCAAGNDPCELHYFVDFVCLYVVFFFLLLTWLPNHHSL